jgi:hypothetical protein
VCTNDPRPGYESPTNRRLFVPYLLHDQLATHKVEVPASNVHKLCGDFTVEGKEVLSVLSREGHHGNG